jgi:hypothetical protein
MGQWDLAVVVIKVGVLASGGEREGLLKSLDAQHGGIMERTQCYRQESNATRIRTETFDRTYAPGYYGTVGWMRRADVRSHGLFLYSLGRGRKEVR